MAGIFGGKAETINQESLVTLLQGSQFFLKLQKLQAAKSRTVSQITKGYFP